MKNMYQEASGNGTIHLSHALTEEEKKTLSAFVEAHPHGNIFQTPAMFEVYRDVPGYQPRCIMYLENGHIMGSMTAVRIQNPALNLLGTIMARSLIIGGPLIRSDHPGILKALLDAYFNLAMKPWDTAAGVLMVAEAGGRCTTSQGDPYSVEAPDCLVSNGLIHEALLAIKRGLP